MKNLRSGITFLELLIGVGFFIVLIFILVLAINPGKEFSKARDDQRMEDVIEIALSVRKFMNEHGGVLPGTSDKTLVPNFPKVSTCIGIAPTCFNLGSAGKVDGKGDGIEDFIVPKYMSSIPLDPSEGTALKTGYTIYQNNEGKIVVTAVGELVNPISVQK